MHRLKNALHKSRSDSTESHTGGSAHDDVHEQRSMGKFREIKMRLNCCFFAAWDTENFPSHFCSIVLTDDNTPLSEEDKLNYNTEELPEQNKSIIWAILKQLKVCAYALVCERARHRKRLVGEKLVLQ